MRYNTYHISRNLLTLFLHQVARPLPRVLHINNDVIRACLKTGHVTQELPLAVTSVTVGLCLCACFWCVLDVDVITLLLIHAESSTVNVRSYRVNRYNKGPSTVPFHVEPHTEGSYPVSHFCRIKTNEKLKKKV